MNRFDKLPAKRFGRWMRMALAGGILAVCLCPLALAQTDDAPKAPAAAPPVQTKGFLDFIKSGGVVGYTIIALSLVSAALVIDTFGHAKPDRMMPAGIIEQSETLARKGRFSEMVTLCHSGDSMLSRILGAGLSQGGFGLAAVRAAMQEQGVKELTKLNQRVGYMGFIGSIGPMLGLLGTVLGMVSSFNVLGSSKGAARADELAVGISYALVTTCEGLIVAIPMMFFHNYFRDRVARLGQECSGVCERVLRCMDWALQAKTASPARPAVAAQASPALAGPNNIMDDAGRGMA